MLIAGTDDEAVVVLVDVWSAGNDVDNKGAEDGGNGDGDSDAKSLARLRGAI